MRTLLGSFYSAAAVLGSVSALLAQEPPSENSVRESLTAVVPPFWTVDSFNVVATSRTGDAASPAAQVRFEAEATSAESLFEEIGQEGPFSILVETVPAQTQRTLYGYADLTYSAGAWNGLVVLDNPVAALGKPKDLFLRPGLVAGSEAAEARLNEIRSSDREKAAAAHLRELESLARTQAGRVAALKAESAAELAALRDAQAEQLVALRTAANKAYRKAEADYTTRFAKLQAEQEPLLTEAEAQLAALRGTQTEELAALRAAANETYRQAEANYATRLAKLKAEQEPLLAEAEAEQARLVAERRTASDAALAEIEAAAAAELDQLRSEYAAARGRIVEKQRQALAELETRLATEKSSLEDQLATAQDVIDLQKQLTLTMDERNKVGAEALATFEQAREQRIAFFKSLPKNWIGQVRCIDEKEGWDATDPLFLWLDEPNAHGWTGWIGRTEDRYVAMTLVSANNSTGFPVKVRLASDKKTSFGSDFYINYTLDLEIVQEGRMVGTAQLPFSSERGNNSWMPECTLLLSADAAPKD